MNKFANKNGIETNGTSPAEQSESGEMISQKLKELYNSVCDEGISDRFLDLLEKLDAVESSSDEESSS